MVSVKAYVGFGRCVGMGNGILELPGIPAFDDTEYYIAHEFSVMQGEAIRSNGLFCGNDPITVLEHVGYGDAGKAEYERRKALYDSGEDFFQEGEYYLFFANQGGESDNYQYFMYDNPNTVHKADENGNIYWNDGFESYGADTVQALNELREELHVEQRSPSKYPSIYQ